MNEMKSPRFAGFFMGGDGIFITGADAHELW